MLVMRIMKMTTGVIKSLLVPTTLLVVLTVLPLNY